MKSSIFFATLLLGSTMFLQSCKDDLTSVAPAKVTQESHTSEPKEAQYDLEIDMEQEVSVQMFISDGTRGQQETIYSITGYGQGNSQTLGPVEAMSDLEYSAEKNSIKGSVEIFVRNTQETLQIQIGGQDYDIRNATSDCLQAQSTREFAELKFSGNACFQDLAKILATDWDANTLNIHVEGTLK